MRILTATALIAGLFSTPSAMAHHSYAMFDANKLVSLQGVVKEWRWTNPHTMLVISVKTPQGKLVDYELEGGSPAVLRLRGWGRTMVKPGDAISITMHPLRNGNNGGAIEAMNTPDGKSYQITKN